MSRRKAVAVFKREVFGMEVAEGHASGSAERRNRGWSSLPTRWLEIPVKPA